MKPIFVRPKRGREERELTINNRFNLGDLQNILQILRSKIRYT
jgi:hypothetical protein